MYLRFINFKPTDGKNTKHQIWEKLKSLTR